MNYPTDDRFHPERFGDTPIRVIEAALAAVDAEQARVALLLAEPIAIVGQTFALSKGMERAEPGWFSPLVARSQRSNAQGTIDPKTAAVMLELTRVGKLPAWVLEYVDLDLVRAAR